MLGGNVSKKLESVLQCKYNLELCNADEECCSNECKVDAVTRSGVCKLQCKNKGEECENDAECCSHSCSSKRLVCY